MLLALLASCFACFVLCLRKVRGQFAEISRKIRGNFAESSRKIRGKIAGSSRKVRGNIAESSRKVRPKTQAKKTGVHTTIFHHCMRRRTTDTCTHHNLFCLHRITNLSCTNCLAGNARTRRPLRASRRSSWADPTTARTSAIATQGTRPQEARSQLALVKHRLDGLLDETLRVLLVFDDRLVAGTCSRTCSTSRSDGHEAHKGCVASSETLRRVSPPTQGHRHEAV